MDVKSAIKRIIYVAPPAAVIFLGISTVYLCNSPGDDIFHFVGLMFGTTWVFIGFKWLDECMQRVDLP